MGAAIGLRQGDLFRRGGGADDGGAQMFGPLHRDLADAAGSGMEDDGLARLHGMNLAQQILRRHALEQNRGGGFIADAVGNFHQPGGGHVGGSGIRTDKAAGVADAVTGFEARDRIAQRFDHAGGLRTQARRHGQRVKPGAMVRVDELTPMALCRMRTCPLPGGGRSTSTYCSTSLPPGLSKRITLVIETSIVSSAAPAGVAAPGG
jgi:hypothetical protein